MDDEVIIVEVEPKISDFRSEDGKHFFARRCYKKEEYNINQPITHKPEYIAIRDPKGYVIVWIMKIDQSKSNFEKGLIVPEGKPIIVSINIHAKDEQLTSRIWYTSFKTLLTHNSTDEFTEEKSAPITRVIIEGTKILCNGCDCAHVSYCKYFNQSPTTVMKNQN